MPSRPIPDTPERARARDSADAELDVELVLAALPTEELLAELVARLARALALAIAEELRR